MVVSQQVKTKKMLNIKITTSQPISDVTVAQALVNKVKMTCIIQTIAQFHAYNLNIV